MNNEMEFPSGCSEEFAELCALSTSGELSAEELAVLDEHVAICAPCAALLREYTSLAHVGMAKLAAARDPNTDIETPFGFNPTKAEARFIGAFHQARSTGRSKLRSRAHLISSSGYWNRAGRPVLLVGTAAMLLLCFGGAYQLGRRTAIPQPQAVPQADAVRPVFAPDPENLKLKAELEEARTALQKATEQSTKSERQFAEVADTKKSLVAQISTLTQKDFADSASLVSVIQQRDAFQQQLTDASAMLARAREDLNHAQQDRQGALFRVATLESEVNGLHTELASTNNSAGTDEKFLSADRDIRELMGARQLYIADVFDVLDDGERSKPFGRVFYTKGKSLIFYAFDLEKQPAYREAKAFQAWGKPDRTSAKPISLGVFYMDSEQNRRWVVKSDNPQVLAQINAVFVTVEPHGGSQKPTGKPFLEAYLHSLPPNHP